MTEGNKKKKKEKRREKKEKGKKSGKKKKNGGSQVGTHGIRFRIESVKSSGTLSATLRNTMTER